MRLTSQGLQLGVFILLVVVTLLGCGPTDSKPMAFTKEGWAKQESRQGSNTERMKMLDSATSIAGQMRFKGQAVDNFGSPDKIFDEKQSQEIIPKIRTRGNVDLAQKKHVEVMGYLCGSKASEGATNDVYLIVMVDETGQIVGTGVYSGPL